MLVHRLRRWPNIKPTLVQRNNGVYELSRNHTSITVTTTYYADGGNYSQIQANGITAVTVMLHYSFTVYGANTFSLLSDHLTL